MIPDKLKNTKLNFGIGVDIESTSRFQGIKKESKLLNRIFSKSELDYCFAKKKYNQHLTARWAAKEAVIKSINSLTDSRISLPDYKNIEICNKKNGVPKIKFKDARFKHLIAKISLSHIDNMAIAFAVVTNPLNKH